MDLISTKYIKKMLERKKKKKRKKKKTGQNRIEYLHGEKMLEK
jgi:hypothetical protein